LHSSKRYSISGCAGFLASVIPRINISSCYGQTNGDHLLTDLRLRGPVGYKHYKLASKLRICYRAYE